jgi:hypothetical protein
VAHTLAVDSFTLFLALRPERPLEDAAVDALVAVLRPGDDDLHVWRESGPRAAPGVDRVRGREPPRGVAAGSRARRRGARRLPGALLEVSALGDEDSLVWRSVP